MSSLRGSHCLSRACRRLGTSVKVAWDWETKLTAGTLCHSGNIDIRGHLGHRVLISLTKETQRATETSTESLNLPEQPPVVPETLFCAYLTEQIPYLLPHPRAVG